MTPNGAVTVALVLVIAATFADAPGLIPLYVAVALIAFFEIGIRSISALRRSVLVMAPLAAFMLIVWVGIVGRAPSEIAAGAPGTRSAAFMYATAVAARLFLIVTIVQIAAMRFEEGTSFAFVCALRAPLAAKRLVVLTLSLVETLRHAVDRAHTALLAAGLVTRRLSLRNLGNGWILVQTVWLTAITTVTARLRDKWPIESTLDLLDPALQESPRPLTSTDIRWLLVAVAAAAGSQIVAFNAA